MKKELNAAPLRARAFKSLSNYAELYERAIRSVVYNEFQEILQNISTHEAVLLIASATYSVYRRLKVTSSSTTLL